MITQDTLDKYKSNIFAKIHCDLIFVKAKIRFIKIYSNSISAKEKIKFTKTYCDPYFYCDLDSRSSIKTCKNIDVFFNENKYESIYPASISSIKTCRLPDVFFNENEYESIYPVLFNSNTNKIEIVTTISKDDAYFSQPETNFKCEIIFTCHMFIYTELDKEGKRIRESVEIKYMYDLLKDDGLTTLNMLLILI